MIDIFRRLFAVALLAGVLAGLFVTAVHQLTTVPVILQAERYEGADAAAPPADAHALAAAHDHGAASGEHEHDAAAWSPQDGWERTLYTGLADVFTGIGFSLLLVALYAFRGDRLDWRKGIYWGLAGFAVVALAPGLGLPPEVPGTEAAPLMARQLWWALAVAATAGGLALVFFGRTPLLPVLGIALIVLPHALGAPQPADYHSAAPGSLAHQFIVAVTMTSFLFWVCLGALTGFFYGRQFRPAAA